jgi:hypothetical protein
MSSDGRPATDDADDATDGETTTDRPTDAATTDEGLAGDATHAATGAVGAIGEAAGEAAQLAGAAAQRAGEVVVDVAGSAAATVQAHAPAVIDASRTTAGIAYRQVRKASDDQLRMGIVFTFGAVAGLVLGRVPRPLVLAALVPIAVLGGTLLGRRVTGSGQRRDSAPR